MKHTRIKSAIKKPADEVKRNKTNINAEAIVTRRKVFSIDAAVLLPSPSSKIGEEK